ncbi:hypothetical protein GTR04_4308 [Trichophyton interdigitale]|uniref:Uncharacterized protein n=1 Tax=Trichophyton interdigitale TaxID=101480 RepID=A0A9P4YI85_9EURO|nr:hypothetical protein GY631_3984 [Trichophyton interdigitale]KAF3894215.1 hypothetical protein GY632_3863 [Trichophyton interdigitale]KAG8208310.1 hypothetical protein GTR04_4308 [Trichophyton interdigitale]
MLRGAGANAEGAGDETPMERSSYQHVFPRKQQPSNFVKDGKGHLRETCKLRGRGQKRVSSEPSRVDVFLSRYVFEASLEDPLTEIYTATPDGPEDICQ